MATHTWHPVVDAMLASTGLNLLHLRGLSDRIAEVPLTAAAHEIYSAAAERAELRFPENPTYTVDQRLLVTV
jgi:hypothetical protein